jgi:hypothetical protein
MAGFSEGRGNWEYRLLAHNSVISQGAGVGLATTRLVSTYSGGQAGFLGFAKHASMNSLPSGKLVVAVPKPGCTAFCDVPTGMLSSVLSIGETYGIYAVGGSTSYITDAAYSAASRVVTIVGPCDTATSRIEVSFPAAGGQIYSTASVNIQ